MPKILVTVADTRWEIEECVRHGMPPLSHYVSVAAVAADHFRAGRVAEAEQHIMGQGAFGRYAFRSSNLEMTAAITLCLVGRHQQAVAKLMRAIDMAPSNIYALIVERDMFGINRVSTTSIIDNVLKWEGKQDVVSIGDSHSHCNFISIPRCEVFWVGPVTMHRIGTMGFSSVGISKDSLHSFPNMVLTFGEIDARVHVHRQRDRRGLSAENIIGDLVGSYLTEVCNLYKEIGDTNIIISAITPALKIPPAADKDATGTNEERKLYAHLLNHNLRNGCLEFGFSYLDPFDNYKDEDGFLSTKLSDGAHHINPHHVGAIEEALANAVSKALPRVGGNALDEE